MKDKGASGKDQQIRHARRNETPIRDHGVMYKHNDEKSKERLDVKVDLLPCLLLGIRVHTVDLDNWRALCQVGSDDHLRK